MALRWAICGAGMIANDFCSELKTLPDGEHEIVAVADIFEENAKSFAERFGTPKVYSTYEEMALLTDIDIVYIAVVTSEHTRLSKLMLNAGHNVLCEKPMAINIKQVREVIELAKEKKKFFMEAICSRCFPIYDHVKKAMLSGSLGNIKLVTATFCSPLTHLKWLTDRSLGGGSLISVGLYQIQFVNWIFNNEQPQKTIAVGNLDSNGVDMDGSIILRYNSGARAILTYCVNAEGGPNIACVYGDKGYIEIPNYSSPQEALLPTGKVVNKIPKGPFAYNYASTAGLRYEADLVRTCIQSGLTECPNMTFTDSDTLHVIIDDVRRQIGITYDCDGY